MNRPSLQISERMQAHMNYPKFQRETPKVLVLESQYWLDTACLRAAEAMGWAVERTPVLQEGKMPREMVAGVLEALVHFQPDFILSINMAGMDEAGLFAGIFADLRVPYVAWFVDDPRTILAGRTCYGSDYAVALSWEAAYCDYLSDCGFAETHTMPLAADTSLFNAPPVEAWEFPPTFVANSMIPQAAKEWDWMTDHPATANAIKEAFAAGKVDRHSFAAGLEAIFSADTLAAWESEEGRHAEMLLFIEGTRRLRLDFVEALKSADITVCGDDAWQSIAPQCKPYLNYSRDLPAYYQHCAVNLNTTSIQMATAANQRVFDCPATGGFLLTDAQSSLADLFEVDKEVAQYHDHEEALQLLQHYQAHPQARLEIIQRARTRILNEHTYIQRLHQIRDILKARFG